jgi:UDP-3-O-[3-hydroxymyristoyl] glucosamine N-acyltransferase
VLRVADPFSAFNALLAHFSPEAPMDRWIHPSAQIGRDCRIEMGAVVGADVVIGDRCIVHAGAVLYPRTVLGDRVRVHAGAVLGGHAYFYRTRTAPDPEGGPEHRHYEKMRTTGRVVIGDDVEIGANTTIDAGATGDTVIGRGTKLDNLVHIGHGAVIGEHCLLAAQVGVGGKTIIGDRCIFWGQVGISKDLTIGDDTVAYAQSGIKNSLPGGKVWFGSPVREAREKMKELAATKDLYAMWRDWGRGDG